MLYRRSVNKLMHRAILLLSLSPRLSPLRGAIPQFRFNESSGIRIKIPNSYSSASVDLHNSGSRNKPTIVSSRSAAVDDTLRRGEGCRLQAGERGGREKGGGVGNRIACLPRIFPPSCGNSFHGSERRAAKTELCDYIPL